MNQAQLKRMREDKGFIAALDQSGGSTPKALRLYGVMEDEYKNEDEMFEKVHEMRTRIIKSSSFDKEKILGAILFKKTMNSKIDGLYTADFLWEKKGIVPILKVDEGLADEFRGSSLMKEMKGLDELLETAKQRNIFATKMRSLIKEYDEEMIGKVVKQQFDYAKKICKAGFVPIIEPEVDINSADKEKIEAKMKEFVVEELKSLPSDYYVMFKFTIPTKDNLFKDLYDFPQVVRIVALSGGYSREEANKRLSRNDRMIASFSRALTEGLSKNQSDKEFDDLLGKSIDSIYKASLN